MEISFNKNPNDASGAEPVVETQTVSTPAGDAVVCTNTHPEPVGGLVMGDVLPTFDQIILPRLNLCHSVGLLKDQFSPGAFVFDQRLVIYTPPVIRSGAVEKAGSPPAIVTVLGLRKTRFVENVKGGARGLILDSEDQVRAAGGTTNYQEWALKAKDGMKRFDYMAEVLLAIERPESCVDDDTVFTFAVGPLKYALALYSMKASAFTVAKKTIFTARSLGCLSKGYPTHSWALSSILKQTPDKQSTYWLPVLVPNRKSTPAFLEFASSVLNAKQVDTPEGE